MPSPVCQSIHTANDPSPFNLHTPPLAQRSPESERCYEVSRGTPERSRDRLRYGKGCARTVARNARCPCIGGTPPVSVPSIFGAYPPMAVDAGPEGGSLDSGMERPLSVGAPTPHSTLCGPRRSRADGAQRAQPAYHQIGRLVDAEQGRIQSQFGALRRLVR